MAHGSGLARLGEHLDLIRHHERTVKPNSELTDDVTAFLTFAFGLDLKKWQ